MAMINCPECGCPISDKATSCPHCGCPITPKVEGGVLMKRSKPAKFVVAATVFLYIFAALCGLGIYGAVALMNYEPDARTVAELLLIFCAVITSIALFAGIASTINFIKNNSLPKDMIVYDNEKDEVTMVALNGKKYTFKPCYFIDLSRNVLNDNVVKVRFYDNGKDRSVKLGWTLDASQADCFLRAQRNKKN